ncbi:hypothetical protein SAZ10_02615 [Mesorhizobium sp. BAC0120]|uniref:hypothetical protein n=1 Tax=Mesorhizobium sp. BAC0120 TaxID=3090670 RepID=UPI00298C7E9B|nr:hypothetical protein [Mesorhizobium sp. BAC0120]MDW6020650.1 hypothetical protein [Mesorhizobium sp. BAC0120]
MEAVLALPAADSVASLDERMKAAGMIPLSDLLAGNTPLEKWMAHTGVRDLASFEEWLTMKHREFMTMRMSYELGDKDQSDELYEWVFAHAAAFGEVAANFRAMKERASRAPGAEAQVEALRKALQPFSSFAEHAIEHLPDGSAIWANSSRERICDWFGPSDFAAALSLKEG